MKKYVGLLIIILMLPFMSQKPAYANTTILTDDIYYGAEGLAPNTQELRIVRSIGVLAVPEPSALVLLSLGLLVIASPRKRIAVKIK